MMGTILEITLVTSDPARAQALIERCFAEAARLEMIFTTWREDGELARLNARAGQGPQKASPELIWILRDAKGFTRETNGVFDVTVAPLIALWREAERRGAAPNDAEIAVARAAVGAERIRIDAKRGTTALDAGMSVDLGGLAKGWALDRLGEFLQADGVDRALLNFGGSSLLALGAPIDDVYWRVAVNGGAVLLLRNESASVSSSLSQFFEIAGRRYGHIVDPRTGRPIQHQQLAVVVAAAGSLAEAWSKALVILPTAEGVALAEHRDALEAGVYAEGVEPVQTSGLNDDPGNEF
jgi:thiamine biosynthesis lipoprotein